MSVPQLTSHGVFSCGFIFMTCFRPRTVGGGMIITDIEAMTPAIIDVVVKSC